MSGVEWTFLSVRAEHFSIEQETWGHGRRSLGEKAVFRGAKGDYG